MGNRAYLQGTPWHEEQIKRTCANGSKYCLYNKNICTCKISRYYHKKCVGKGECDEFESKGNSAKITSVSQVSYVKKQKENKNMNEQKLNIPDEKAENFIRLANKRTNKILEDIDILTNLSNRNQYNYTDEQVDKIFSAIEDSLKFAKENFKNKQNIGKFSL